MHRAIYRCRQALHAFRPQLEDSDLEFARELLSEPEAELFFAMERSDQRHALAVALRLRQGTDDRSLLVAALVHDCGKGSVPVWLRALNVVSPATLSRFAAEGRGWRDAAHRLRHHVELSVAKANDAGSSAMTVRLIHGKIEPAEAWRYELLLAADDTS